MMDESRLKEIENRLFAATPGPWEYDETRDTHDCPIYVEGAVEKYDYISPNRGGVVGSSEWVWLDPSDGEFIANAWQDIKDLLAYVRGMKSRD